MLRAPWRPLSAVIVIAAVAMSTVLVTPRDVGAATGHAKRHMPSLIGRSRAQVFSIMRADALFFVTEGPGSANGTWRDVVAQSPKAGTVVDWHSEATLTVSNANPHGPRAVPRLIGLSRARTFAAMERAQLFFTTSGPGSTDGKWVVVLHQTPAPGTRVAWHAEVALKVSTVKPHPKKVAHRPVKKPVTTTTKPKPKPKPKKTCTPTTTTSQATTTSTTPTTSTSMAGSTTTSAPTTTTTSPRATTTTTICKVPTTTTTLKPKKTRPKRYRVGDATWYSYFPGRCATWYLPMGTRIAVRDLATGKVIHCIVTDREGAHGNRVVDLSETQFAQLAPLAKGVVVVRVSW
ncbi:MAG TPA: PASTA domain-containing protein [Acidimicrobiales bacterium]